MSGLFPFYFRRLCAAQKKHLWTKYPILGYKFSNDIYLHYRRAELIVKSKAENDLNSDIVPTQEAGRLAVERARKIVRDNHEMILKLKEDSNIQISEDDLFCDASSFSTEDTYTIDLYKVKSPNGFADIFKDLLNINV